jgi:hypothetical protein
VPASRQAGGQVGKNHVGSAVFDGYYLAFILFWDEVQCGAERVVNEHRVLAFWRILCPLSASSSRTVNRLCCARPSMRRNIVIQPALVQNPSHTILLNPKTNVTRQLATLDGREMKLCACLRGVSLSLAMICTQLSICIHTHPCSTYVRALPFPDTTANIKPVTSAKSGEEDLYCGEMGEGRRQG